jgi:diphthamide biosynthesis protein 7
VKSDHIFYHFQIFKMVTTNNMQTLHIWDTEYSADSVEWCPISPFQNIFVCGTYQLATTESTEVENRKYDDTSKNLEISEGSAVCNTYKRSGRLYLFAMDSLKGLYLLQTLEMPAILDCKWCHCKIDGKILLAVANAVGEVLLYEMRTTGEPKSEEDKMNIKGIEPWLSCTLSLLCNSVIAQDVDSETLALSLDWSTGRCKFEHEQNSPLISVSDSKGYISLLTLSDLMFEKRECWKAHDFEAWITAFDYWNDSVVYTGKRERVIQCKAQCGLYMLSIHTKCVFLEVVLTIGNFII